MSVIRARFRATQGAFTLDAEFSTPARGVTGLFGPSGAGKSTLLRCIAGLQRTYDAYFAIGDHVWQDESKGIFAPVHERGIGYVFQEPSLFPHMTVRKNILYGYRRIAGRQRTIQFRDAVEWTGIATLLERMPVGLSGGERQRVAMARALMSSPRLLLMDEPLSALDEAARAEIIPCLDRLHRELSIPVIYVSHALREIGRIADTLILLDSGRVTQTGPIQDVLPAICASPDAMSDGDPFSVLDAPILDYDDTYRLTRLQTPFGPLWAGRIDADLGDVKRIQIAARDVSIGKTRDEASSIVNQLPARIHAVTELSPGHVLLELLPAEMGEGTPKILSMITRRSWDHLHLAVGQSVYARIKGVSILP